jgi:hypothetical protein
LLTYYSRDFFDIRLREIWFLRYFINKFIWLSKWCAAPHGDCVGLHPSYLSQTMYTQTRAVFLHVFCTIDKSTLAFEGNT